MLNKLIGQLVLVTQYRYMTGVGNSSVPTIDQRSKTYYMGTLSEKGASLIVTDDAGIRHSLDAVYETVYRDEYKGYSYARGWVGPNWTGWTIEE